MKVNGFTLIELLAVIIVLGLLSTLALTNINNVVNKSKNDVYRSQIYDILDSVYDYTLRHTDFLPDENIRVKYTTLAHLINDGLIDSDIKDPKMNSLFDYSLVISVSYVDNNITSEDLSKKYGNYLYKIEEDKTNAYSYEFDSSFKDFTISLNETYTLPNIPSGGIRIITKNNKQVDVIDTSKPNIYEVTDIVLSADGKSTFKTIKVAVGT